MMPNDATSEGLRKPPGIEHGEDPYRSLIDEQDLVTVVTEANPRSLSHLAASTAGSATILQA